MKRFDFKKMMAYEFSSLTQRTTEVLSSVTVLDCKHCNDPYQIEKHPYMSDSRNKSRC